MTIRTVALLIMAGFGATATAAPDDPLDQRIDPDQEVSSESAVLDGGHVDVGPRYVDDAWTLLVHDDSADPPVWRYLDSTVLRVGDAALQPVPDDEAYAFVPAPVGTEVHVVPQIQQPDVVWLGWNTQDPAVMETIDRGVTFRLRGVDGPAEMVMFLQSGDLGGPRVMWDSRQPYPQDFWVEVNTHAHANWVFPEPGVYLVEIEIAADLVTGEQVSDIQVVRFAVGDDTAPGDALAADYEAPQPSVDESSGVADGEDGSGAADGDDGDAAGGDTDGVAPALLVVVAGGVVLLLALIVVLARGRQARARASVPTGDTEGTA
jgi:putative ABC transporter-associated repeat protein